MTRIKLITPEKSIAKLKYRVRITDINYGNHLGNDSLVSILHNARMEWLTSMGYSELSMEGVSLIMNELVVNYLNESFYGDELEISISIGEVTRVSFEIYYIVEAKRKNEKILIAKAKTGMVCFDYQKKKSVSVPDAFIQKINSNN
jgi:acyl-CoA thioester hydrolase